MDFYGSSGRHRSMKVVFTEEKRRLGCVRGCYCSNEQSKHTRRTEGGPRGTWVLGRPGPRPSPDSDRVTHRGERSPLHTSETHHLVAETPDWTETELRYQGSGYVTVRQTRGGTESWHGEGRYLLRTPDSRRRLYREAYGDSVFVKGPGVTPTASTERVFRTGKHRRSKGSPECNPCTETRTYLLPRHPHPTR